MPEGDTLRRLADKLGARFVGERVVSNAFRHPRLATSDLSGKVLSSVDATGKHLLCRFDDDITMHLHLLMQGKVMFDTTVEAPEWRRRFEIEFESGTLTGVDVPLLHLIPTRNEQDLLGQLGPDLCGSYDHAVALARLEAAQDMQLAEALLDQTVIAGFGNIYAVETPFICGVSPFTRIGDIDDVRYVLSIGASLIRTNATLGPQNTTGRNLHLAEQWVLPSRTTSCGICGDRLGRLSGQQSPWRRRTAWCPSCQPNDATRPDLDRAARLLSLHPARRMIDFANGELLADTAEPVVARRR